MANQEINISKMYIIKIGKVFLVLFCCLLGSCGGKSKPKVELSQKNELTNGDNYVQVLFFDPNAKNEKLFFDFQVLLHKNNIHIRGTSLDLGMAAFEIDREDETRLVKLIRSEKNLFDTFNSLFDQDFSKKIRSGN